MIGWLARLLHRPEILSAEWLKDQQRREQRIEFHSVPIRWPVKKLLNESSLWNREKLKRRA